MKAEEESELTSPHEAHMHLYIAKHQVTKQKVWRAKRRGNSEWQGMTMVVFLNAEKV